MTTCNFLLFLSLSFHSWTWAKTSAGTVETRCGWFSNPTPANLYLTDKDGTWLISEQGGYRAQGIEDLDFSGPGWIETNGHYGYRCACVEVVVDLKEKRVVRILKLRKMPLNKCKNDKKLPK